MHPHWPLDPSFGGGDGIATFPHPDGDAALVGMIQPDGKIVIAGGSAAPNLAPQWSLVRLNSDGSVDTSFGTGGKVTTPLGNFTWRVLDAAGAAASK